MEASDEVAVATFPIGPSSTAGRLIAVSLLTSKSLTELLSIARASVRRSTGRLACLRRFVPSLRSPQVILVCVIALALLVRRMAASRMVATKVHIAYRRQFWKKIMSNACTYDEWAHAARMSQKECGRQKDAALYDEALVRTKLQELRVRRKEGIVQDMLFSLRTDLVRNLGNMCNPELHMGRFQVPEVIQDYIDEVRYHLRAICDSDYEDLQIEDKLAFIRETRHAFGRTALLLSGGGALGAFHAGVVRTLIEHGLLPRVIAGASVGSIVCSLIATRTWSDLQSFFGDNLPALELFDQLGGIFNIVSRLFTNGALLEIRQLQHMLRDLTHNMTFQEAFDTTGRVLGISVSSPRKHEPPRCLNYLTSPHVVIWSAVTASCAFPGLYEAQELMAKDRHGQLVPYHSPVQVGSEDQRVGVRHWRDGSLESDLPMVQLTELFNVNHFVVSQANPHLTPLLRLKDIIGTYGGDFAAKLAHISEMEVQHRCHQILEWGFPMGGIAKVFAQHWEGDITIVMPATLAQFAKIIQNPTPMELKKAVNQGRRCTWEKLSAIKANCGIELMLDECVAELNRRCILKRSLERRATQASGATNRTFGAKRIPSWNVIARENSWGSLDEEGIIDSAPHGGGPWAVPSIRRLKSSCNDGSDSESENMDFAHSWTRAGGPLMRTASATQFIQEQAGEPIFQLYKDDLRSQDSSDEADVCFPAVQALPKEVGISKRGNKIVERSAPGCSARPHTTKETDVSCTEEQEHCASQSYQAMESNTTVSQKNSGNSPCGSIFKMNEYLSEPEPDDEMGDAEASLREVLGVTITSDAESNQPCRKLTHVAFGSFIDKVSDPNVENDGC